MARNAGALAAASTVSKGALFVWQLILASLLGPHDFGIYGTVGALFAVGVPVASFGMGLIAIRDVARYPERAGRYWTALLFMQTVLAAVAYAGANLAASTLDYGPTIQAYVAIACTSLLIDMFGNMGNELLLAQERMLSTSLVEIGHVLARLLLAGAALLLGYGLLGVYMATIITGVGRWWVLWTLLLRTGVRPLCPLDRAVARSLLANSAPIGLTAILVLAYQHTDKLLTTYFIGAEGTGYLTVAFVIVFGVIELLSTTVLVATFPMMSRYYGSSVMGFMVEKLAFFTALVALPLCLILSVFSVPVAGLFGEAFGPAAGVLAILIWYTLLTMVGNVFAQGLMVQNRQRRLMLIRGSGLLANLALNILLLPRLGIRGAALSTLCAEVLVFALFLANFREVGLERRRLVRQLGRVALIGVLVAGVMWAAGQIHPLAGLAAGSGAYLLAALFGRLLQPDDWDLLYRLVSVMPGGGILRRYWKRDVALNW